jgi:hypothetical protein
LIGGSSTRYRPGLLIFPPPMVRQDLQVTVVALGIPLWGRVIPLQRQEQILSVMLTGMSSILLAALFPTAEKKMKRNNRRSEKYYLM